MRVLVTGGAGYIGSHTVLELLVAGHTVHVLDNFVNASREALRRVRTLAEHDFEVSEQDVRDAAAVARIVRAFRPDAAVHFAGLKAVDRSTKAPLDYYGANVAGTLAVLEALSASGCRRFVFSSSATVYGDPARMPLAEDSPRGATSPYGRTKLVVEQILEDLALSDTSWSVAMLRYFNPVGAHPSGMIGEDPAGVPGNLMPFVAQVAIGRRPALEVFGDDYDTPDGSGVRDYVHVVDLARGHLAALEWAATAGRGCEPFNLGTGRGSSVLELAKAYGEASGRRIPVVIAPRRPGDVARLYADPARAERVLGWRAERGLAEMCADSWNWQRRNPEGYAEPVGDAVALPEIPQVRSLRKRYGRHAPRGQILVLGGDGYIGWPLALELAASHPEKQVLIADSFLTRRNAAKLGGRSLLPLASAAERLAASREILGLGNLEFREVDCADPDQTAALFADVAPEVVYHLAHQRAAPYSMLGLREAVETVVNNEVGFLNLVWSIKDRCPDCHLVKLGSFGAYAKRGLDIPEGDAIMAINGVASAAPVPFPRSSDDFYHATKINDASFARVACQNWDLRITDVMQSTVFGAGTDRTLADERLHTRFDYDAILGTVLNRFVAQAVGGLPLTVYGNGEQSTGIMTLEDCIAVLVSLAYSPGPPGTHRIVNSNPGSHSINELAALVQGEAAGVGLAVRIDRSVHNPRFEDGVSYRCRVDTGYMDSVLTPMPLGPAIARSIGILLPHRGGIDGKSIEPTHTWLGGKAPRVRTGLRQVG